MSTHEMIHQPRRHDPRAEPIPKFAEGLPTELLELARALPPPVLAKLKGDEKSDREDAKPDLAEILATMPAEKRENALSYGLYRLFDYADLRVLWRAEAGDGGLSLIPPVPADLEGEVTDIMNGIWSNRKKEKEQFSLVSDRWYQNFVYGRQRLAQKLKDCGERVKNLQAKMAKNKQVRMGKRLEVEYTEASRQLQEAADALQGFDRGYENIGWMEHKGCLGFDHRRKKERDWMEPVALVARHLDAVEFATAMLEAWEQQVFHQEAVIVANTYAPIAARTGRSARGAARMADQARPEATRILTQLRSAIDRWASEHQVEGVLTQTRDSATKQEDKLVRYLLQLADSYRREVARGSEKGTLEATTRYMEVAMNILGAKTGKKD